MTDTQPDTQTHCIHAAVDYSTEEGREHEIVAVRCKLAIERSRRGHKHDGGKRLPPARKCKERCEQFEPCGKYDLAACKCIMAKVLAPWLPNAGHFIYDYLGIERDDVIEARTR